MASLLICLFDNLLVHGFRDLCIIPDHGADIHARVYALERVKELGYPMSEPRKPGQITTRQDKPANGLGQGYQVPTVPRIVFLYKRVGNSSEHAMILVGSADASPICFVAYFGSNTGRASRQ